jgi:hypothetical protein
MSAIFSAGEELFGGLSGLAKAYGGEQNELYKALFAASKAFAVADSVIKIQQGIAGAASLPFPSNLAAMATVVAETSSIVSTIAGTQFSGAYDKGGDIPAGSYGLVGEKGPELIQGPVSVISREKTASIFKELRESSSDKSEKAVSDLSSNITSSTSNTREINSSKVTTPGLKIAGAFDSGGMIKRDEIGLVGEFGPELIEGPTNVRSRKETAEIFNGAGGDGSQPKVENNLRIVNVIDPSVVNDFMSSGEGERVILNVMQSNPEMIKALANG